MLAASEAEQMGDLASRERVINGRLALTGFHNAEQRHQDSVHHTLSLLEPLQSLEHRRLQHLSTVKDTRSPRTASGYSVKPVTCDAQP
jgi:hypothetical protein